MTAPKESALLERKEAPNAEVETEPELEIVVQKVAVSGGLEDSSLTVVENPSVEGYLGILLSRHYEEKYGHERLGDVIHVRIDIGGVVKELKE